MTLRASTRGIASAIVLSGAALSACVGDIGGQGEGIEPPYIDPSTLECDDPAGIFPGPAPLRRLTRFEYNNTVRDLLGDTTLPANAFPSEETGNGFGNDANAQSVSSLLAETYGTVAEGVAQRATETPTALGKIVDCAGTVDGSDAAAEKPCVRTLIEKLATGAFRRPVLAAEVDELVALYDLLRADADFPTSVAAIIEAVLQSPDFLYRVELGQGDTGKVRRPTGHEMASRLSYFFWGTQPDADLLAAAESGELDTAEGVVAQAERMIDDDKAKQVIRFFFDNLLPISNLSQLERDEALFPTYSAAIGAAMREETQRFLEYEIFEGPGSWKDALVAPYTFLNGPLAEFYGVEGVSGDEWQKVDLDTSQRLGLLTQAGMVAGTIHSNMTNPVTRGSFLVQKIMCRKIPLPTGDIAAKIKPPNPDSGDTARERYSAHSADPICQSCHQHMDPLGLALENYDPVGLWRDQENGVTIDASGGVPGMEGGTKTPIELVRKISESPETRECFPAQWMNFAYGRTLTDADECVQGEVQAAFAESGQNIRQLLVQLTQTDAFLYLPVQEKE
ncbi:MAG: DUF1592 domain-containing protein [Polyangiaceae bacterium]